MNDEPARPDQRWATFAIILIAVGAIFLLGELFNFRLGPNLWPLFLLVPGIALLATAFGRSEANAGTAIPGTILTTLGLIFLYQSATGRWESWAYIWALIPLSVGLALIVVGTRNDDETTRRSGTQTARTFAIIFVAGLVFFELVIFDRPGFGGYFLPIALIAGGGVMLWMHYRKGGTHPWAEKLRGLQPSSATPGPTAGPTAANPPSPPPPVQPTAATPPPPAAQSHFPEDELPHEAASDDAPFPPDEHQPEPTPEPPKPRRRTGTKTRKSTPSRTPSKRQG